MTMCKSPDLTYELGQLLSYISDVAIAIRMNSAYNRARPQDPKVVPYDVFWLSDSLHNLFILGEACRHQDAKQVVWACDHLISLHEGYRQGETPHPISASETFHRWGECDVSLDRALSLFKTLREKAAEAITP